MKSSEKRVPKSEAPISGQAVSSKGSAVVAEPRVKITPVPPAHPRKARIQSGREMRTRVPREHHGEYRRRAGGRDLVAILQQSNEGRLPHLVPIRFGRMLRSPFAFYRGAAALMAYDLGHQSCGRGSRAV